MKKALALYLMLALLLIGPVSVRVQLLNFQLPSHTSQADNDHEACYENNSSYLAQTALTGETPTHSGWNEFGHWGKLPVFPAADACVDCGWKAVLRARTCYDVPRNTSPSTYITPSTFLNRPPPTSDEFCSC